MNETRTPSMPTRRAVTKAAAWSAPVIAAAVAAPMAAASPGQRTMTWTVNTTTKTITLALAVVSGTDWPSGSIITVTLAGGGATFNGASKGPTGAGFNAAYNSTQQWTLTLTRAVTSTTPITVTFTYDSNNSTTIRTGTGNSTLTAVDGNGVAAQSTSHSFPS